ncbi:MAG: heat-inducible transcriptional repressor, partial [Polyangiales bacterium]
MRAPSQKYPFSASFWRIPSPGRPCYFPRLSELSHRGRRILYVAITEYIQNGEPVGSRTLAKRDGIDLSPATIRNELADLEEAGFLHQPHTSSGRVPTTRGFRVFVDALVQMREVSASDRAVVMQRLDNLEPGDVLSEAGELLSALTGAAAVVNGPKPEEERLAQLRFMPLREGQLLAILVTKGGAVQNRVVAIPDGFEPDGVERIHNLLDELLRESPLSLVAVRNELARELGAAEGAVQSLREKARAIIEAAVDGRQQPISLVIEGQDRLFDRP